MFEIGLTAALVGAIHSLSPTHWVPIVLIMKAKRWSALTAILGALTVAASHIVISIAGSLIAIELGMKTLDHYEELIESYSGIGLVIFGLLYSLMSFKRHWRCVHHTHHHDRLESTGKIQKRPFMFLLLLGFGPCVAVLPALVTASAYGLSAVFVASLCFAGGTVVALSGATLVTRWGLMKLDHPILEHYGDMFSGLGVAALGLWLWLHGHGA